jgi:NitT/TauT family transport system ATP-binding protein
MIFELRDVTLELKSRGIFKNLNLRFEGPGLFAIVGPSGCGKSTLLRILAGLQKVSRGAVHRSSVSLKTSFIFQEPQLLEWRTTLENILLPFELKGERADPLKLQELIASVRLEEALELFPRELSGGMKMRASLARAFLPEPHVLFCDEPFAALDEVTREELALRLRQEMIRKKGLCFFVTHHLSEALSVADHILIFRSAGNPDPDLIPVRREAPLAPQLAALKETLRESFR